MTLAGCHSGGLIHLDDLNGFASEWEPPTKSCGQYVQQCVRVGPYLLYNNVSASWVIINVCSTDHGSLGLHERALGSTIHLLDRPRQQYP